MTYSSISKEAKEAFVSGHEGTTEWEILLVLSSCPIGIFFYRTLLCGGYYAYRNSVCSNDWKVLSILEMIFIICPMILCQTVFLYSIGVYWMLIEVLVGFVILVLSRRSEVSSKDLSVDQLCKEVMTMYRSSISILTFIAILAVDFHVFPRNFAKTETHGCGLMDLGAASFVMANAFCSKYARLGTTGNSNVSIVQAILKAVPILCLGFIRLFTTKGLEYQEHVSEYGIHWNFYFTLAYLTTIVPLVFCRCKRNVRIFTCLMSLICYQSYLTLFEGQSFIETSQRSCEDTKLFIVSCICSIFVANREGILGCIGYTVLYVISEEIALLCVWNPVQRNKKKNDDSENSDGDVTQLKQVGVRLGIMTTVLWIFHVTCTKVIEIEVSRRSTNFSFVVWTIALNLNVLFFIWLVFYLTRNACCLSPIFTAINRNGLVMFLIANLFTGLINLSFNTLHISNLVAFIILVLYLGLTSLSALVLDKVLNVSVRVG